jgi:hypothetical protein
MSACAGFMLGPLLAGMHGPWCNWQGTCHNQCLRHTHRGEVTCPPARRHVHAQQAKGSCRKLISPRVLGQAPLAPAEVVCCSD